MISLALPASSLQVLAVAAHPDDVEIACGGTLLELASSGGLSLTVATLTGTSEREDEARAALQAFVPGAVSQFFHLPDGRLPARWEEVKEALEELAVHVRPDLVLGPSRQDAHQDHRLLATLIPTVWRDALVFEYEIPKWDGDFHPVTTYVPVSSENAVRKFELLDAHYVSQRGRDWWDREVFLGIMRLRGMECRTHYAEGFVVRKATIARGTNGAPVTVGP